MVGRLFEGRPPKSSDIVLDPGCGTGAFLKGIIRWCKRNNNPVPELVGVESEPGRAQQARMALEAEARVEIRLSDFLAAPFGSFDYIIGNPPYVSITRLSEREKRSFRANYVTARGRFDLYLLFFERALKSLKRNGRMVFITPEKFLYVETAAPLRRLLAQKDVADITMIDEQVFGTLVTYPTVSTIVNRPPSAPTRVQLRDGSQRRCTLKGDGASWLPAMRGVAAKSNTQPTLSDLCIRISCGVATGADGIFVRDMRGLEPELRAFARSTIAGRELTVPGKLDPPRYAMLTPYTDDGSLIRENQLGPLGEYLRRPRIRQQLAQRTCARRKPWYAFHENPPLLEILRPKILCKDITRRPYFWIDREGKLVPRHSVYYIVPEDPTALDAICRYLNSEEVAQWLTEHCQRAASGFLRLQSNILKMLPVPRELRPHPAHRSVSRYEAYPSPTGFLFPYIAR